MAENVPPQSLEAEEHVLGSMLLTAAAIGPVVELLSPTDFYRESHQTIYRAILGLHERGDPVDPIILSAELEKLGALSAVGGNSRISELAALVPSTSNVAHYAAIVAETSRARSVIRTAQAAQEAAQNGGLALHPEKLDALEDAIRDARKLPGEPATPRGPLFVPAEEFVQRQFAAREPLLGTRDTGVLVVGGFALLAGRPGAGKTTLLLDLACHLAAGVDWPPSDGTDKAPTPWPCHRPLKIALIENEGPQESFRAKLDEKLRRFQHEIPAGGIKIFAGESLWGTFSFADRSIAGQVRSELDQHEIDVVVGDPLGSLGMEGVGSPAETLAFVQLLRPLGLGTTRAFLFLHHFRERVEKAEDELSRLSGAWGGHLDTLLTLGATNSEDQLRLAYAKLRWARSRIPHPIVLGKIFNTLGFEAIAEEGDPSLIEPAVYQELADARAAGRGFKGWQGVDAIRERLDKRRTDVKKALEGAPHLFTSVTGGQAKAMGAKSPKAILWGLVEWGDSEAEPPAEEPAENPGQEPLAGEDGIPF